MENPISFTPGGGKVKELLPVGKVPLAFGKKDGNIIKIKPL
jgi:hypothetical protein